MYRYACMHACMYVCMDACMHACMHVCMHVCMYACMHVCMYACMHVCMYACMHVCMYACMHVCMYACMYACMYVCMYRNIFLFYFMQRHVCILQVYPCKCHSYLNVEKISKYTKENGNVTVWPGVFSELGMLKYKVQGTSDGQHSETTLVKVVIFGIM